MLFRDAKVRKRAEQIRARWKDVPTVSSVLGPDRTPAPDEPCEGPDR